MKRRVIIRFLSGSFHIVLVEHFIVSNKIIREVSPAKKLFLVSAKTPLEEQKVDPRI